jgi:uncharacterized protein
MSRYITGRAAGAGLFLAAAALAAAADPTATQSHAEVRIPTPDPAVTLAGTLSLPEADAGRALVIFLTGSGDHGRDQVISGTPMFHHIAAALLDAGFATLRLDDRGTGESTGPTTTASTTAHRVADMGAVVAWAAGHEKLERYPVVLLGHSEGAMVAAGVAARSSDVDALVLMGAPARSGAVVWIDQQLAGVAAHLGRPATELGPIRERLEAVVTASASGAPEAAIEDAGLALFAATDMDLDEARESGLIAGFVARVASPWFRYFLAHDPVDDYRRVTVPVLAVYGSTDRLTAPALNAGPLRAALQEVGSPDLTFHVLPDQDHFFLRADHLEPGQHRFGEMHVAPELLATLTEWLQARY